MLLQRLGIPRGTKDQQGTLAETDGFAGDAKSGSELLHLLLPPVSSAASQQHVFTTVPFVTFELNREHCSDDANFLIPHVWWHWCKEAVYLHAQVHSCKWLHEEGH